MDRGTLDLSFDWDVRNIAHLARHLITPAEVEAFFHNDPAISSHEVVAGEGRWTAVGATGVLRVLVLVFTLRGEKKERDGQ